MCGMGERKGFSIITPLYNGRQYLDTLLSILQDNILSLHQNNINLPVELILVNDSPDDAEAVRQDLVSKGNDNVTLVTHEQNTGIHQSRVDGLSVSHGEYVLFLDQDDVISADYLRCQYVRLQKTSAKMVIANGWMETASGKRKLYRSHFSQAAAKRYKNHVRWGNMIISPGMCLIRYDAIPLSWQQNALKVNGADDALLWILMGIEFGSLGAVLNSSLLYTHGYTGINCSDDREKMCRSAVELCQIVRKQGAKAKWANDVLSYRIGVTEDGKIPQISFCDKFWVHFWYKYLKAKLLPAKLIGALRRKA